MNIWKMPSVTLQPEVTLVRWRAVRIFSGDQHWDILLGWCVQSSCGRVSTPIVAFDAVAARATTRSGRIYTLAGEPGFDNDADYVFQGRFGPLLHDENHQDVGQSYLERILKVFQEPSSGPRMGRRVCQLANGNPRDTQKKMNE